VTYLTPKQVSIKTGLKYTTVLEWAKGGLLPARIIQNRKKSKYFFVEKESGRERNERLFRRAFGPPRNDGYYGGLLAQA